MHNHRVEIIIVVLLQSPKDSANRHCFPFYVVAFQDDFPVFRLVKPMPVLLSDFGGPSRVATRPVSARDPGFDEAFDDDTLFFDGFYVRSLDKIVLVGPALFNLASSLRFMHLRARPSGESCRFQVLEFDRHVRVVVDAPAGTHALAFTGPLGVFELRLQMSMAGPFAGTRMLITKSRNNDIAWIMDWIRYHRDRHGADAVLIYDNRTTNYDSSTMLEALRCVGGLKAAKDLPKLRALAASGELAARLRKFPARKGDAWLC